MFTIHQLYFVTAHAEYQTQKRLKDIFWLFLYTKKRKAYFIVVRFEFQKENLGSVISLNRWQAVL